MESRSYTSFRKGRKLLAEKKRRNRINECLNQIKNLICEGPTSPEMDLDSNKMEKADILESAVKFIQKAKNSTPNSARENQIRYQNGFTRCLQEMTSFLQGVNDVSNSVKYRLVQHVTRNMHSANYNRNMDFVQYHGINGQYLPTSGNQNYIRYNPSLAVPLEGLIYKPHVKSEAIEDCGNSEANDSISNDVWRPW